MAHEELHLNLRNLTLEDYPQLQELMDDVYEDIGGAWPKDTIPPYPSTRFSPIAAIPSSMIRIATSFQNGKSAK